MKVSVIITTYNYANYLSKAIESVLNQTYQDTEVIVVNDGSTDSTSEVVKPYLSKITYLVQKNSGVVIARNNGAQRAKGKYLLFLDADDYMPSNFIEISLNTLKSYPEAKFAYGDKEVFGSKNFRLSSRPWNPYLLQIINYIGLTTIIDHDAFKSVGGFSLSQNKIKSYEDWDFWLKLVNKGYRGVYNPELFYYYRRMDTTNRNNAGILKKLNLRLSVMLQHKRLFVHPFFLMQFPILFLESVMNKASILRRQ